MRSPETSAVKRGGFTTIELIVVLSITLILVAGSVGIFSRLTVSSQLNDVSDRTVQVLRIAQERARAGQNGSRHGVYFDGHGFTLYQGDSYATRDATLDELTTFSSAIAFSTSFSQDIGFARGTGWPSVTGTITVIHDVDGNRLVFINDAGVLDVVY